MSNIKKFLAILLSAVCFNAVCREYESFMLPALFRYSLVDHYNKKYTASIVVPNLGIHGEMFRNFTDSDSFSHVFTSGYYKKNANVRLMWVINIEGNHATPIFYLQENGQRAILLADSLGFKEHHLRITGAPFFKGLNIPVFIIQDRRQDDRYSCYLDALVWGKMVTGKLSDGTYRVPNLLDFLFTHSEKIPLENSNAQLFYVKKLPTTLLATVQNASFMEKYRVESDDTYITSKGVRISFNQFLNNHKKVFAFDYLRSKGVFISYYFYKYLSFKGSIKYGWNIFDKKMNSSHTLKVVDLIFLCASAYCLGHMIGILNLV